MLRVSFLVGLLFFVLPDTALAYIDPGTGSYLFQLLIAGLLGLSFFIKTFWRNIKNFLSGEFKRTQRKNR